MRFARRSNTARQVFLEALEVCGNITAAAAAANLPRSTLYLWRHQEPAFAAAWEDALTLGIAALEDRALELATADNERLIMFLLAARKPEVYGQR